MTVNLSPIGGAGWQFFDNNGVPLSGGLIYTYLAGTSTPQVTYTSASGNIANSNPIVLDSSGRPPNEIWLTSGVSYKFVLQTASFVQIWSMDNLQGLPSVRQEGYITATQGQTVCTVPFTYLLGSNSLFVFVNGSKQINTLNYNETNTTTITFVNGLNVGDIVEFVQ
jgi:hypothetical protein